jgi:hypothetical protein
MHKIALYEMLSKLSPGQKDLLQFAIPATGGAAVGAAVDPEKRYRGALIGLGAGGFGGASTLVKPLVMQENPITYKILRGMGTIGATAGGGFMGSNVSEVVDKMKKNLEPKPKVPLDPELQQMVDAGAVPQQLLADIGQAPQEQKVAAENNAGQPKTPPPPPTPMETAVKNNIKSQVGVDEKKPFQSAMNLVGGGWSKAGTIGRGTTTSSTDPTINSVMGSGQNRVDPGTLYNGWWNWGTNAKAEQVKDFNKSAITPAQLEAAQANRAVRKVTTDPAVQKAYNDEAGTLGKAWVGDAKSEAGQRMMAKGIIDDPKVQNLQGEIATEAKNQAGDWMKNNWGYLLGGAALLGGGMMLMGGGNNSNNQQQMQKAKSPRNPYERDELDLDQFVDPNKNMPMNNPWMQ